MIENDETNVEDDSFNSDGTINPNSSNSYWLNGLAQAQLVYHEATGDVVKSGCGFVAPELEHLVQRDEGGFAITLRV
jgi:hypothetical protein